MTLSIPDKAIPERKVPVIVRKDYTVSLERTSGMTFVHCDITGRWSKTVQKSLDQNWQALLHLHTDTIYALHTPGDRKHEKFLHLFGFSLAGTYTAVEGTIELYKI
jgi:hypothetical protein